jgi:hypothetical protein
MKTPNCLLLLAALGVGVSGCANMNNTQSGALAGTGLGAVTGAIIGEATGHPGAGALIGAATGAVAGGAIGSAEDKREEQEAAVAHAQYENARNQAIARAVTEADIVSMVRNNVGDDIIVNSIRTRGCLWDGTPESVIRLKNAGISDRVITAMQYSTVHAPATAGAAPPPPGGVVVVTPGYYGPRPYYYRRPYYRGW